MLKIVHIADLHIRGLSRHSEYERVFTQLAEKIKNDGVDHVFVGGDIFHTKTSGLSPEYIDFITWMFEKLASVAELHMILGNHDGNLVNFSRQDAISPIVSALKNPKIHLYKKSGVYEFAPGYNWCVFSLFDEEGWQDVKPVPGKINIACYHGPVWGAKTESDWSLEEGLNVDFFKDYDFVFLGDIHKFQYLAYKDTEMIIDEDQLSKFPTAEVIEEIA